MKKNAPTTIDKYTERFPKDTQKLLQQMRRTIRKAAPDAHEKISYGIPTFSLNGSLVHYAGYDNHIGFYPGAAAIVTFKKELLRFKSAKGSVQFPLDEPLPLPLVTRIVRFRVKQSVPPKARKRKTTNRRTRSNRP